MTMSCFNKLLLVFFVIIHFVIFVAGLIGNSDSVIEVYQRGQAQLFLSSFEAFFLGGGQFIDKSILYIDHPNGPDYSDGNIFFSSELRFCTRRLLDLFQLPECGHWAPFIWLHHLHNSGTKSIKLLAIIFSLAKFFKCFASLNNLVGKRKDKQTCF